MIEGREFAYLSFRAESLGVALPIKKEEGTPHKNIVEFREEVARLGGGKPFRPRTNYDIWVPETLFDAAQRKTRLCYLSDAEWLAWLERVEKTKLEVPATWKTRGRQELLDWWMAGSYAELMFRQSEKRENGTFEGYSDYPAMGSVKTPVETLQGWVSDGQ